MTIIRAYQPTDTESILKAWEAASKIAHPFLSDPFMTQERHDIANLYLPNSETWVAEVDDSVVGFISMHENEIGAIFLHPHYHGQGIGYALMAHAKSLYDVLEVEVFENNPIGRAFYDKCGFVQISQYHHEETDQSMLRLRLIVRDADDETA